MTNLNNSVKFIAISLAAGVASIATAASAGDHVSFSYHPYELQTSGGAEKVYERLQRTVKNMCDESGRRTVSTFQAEKECRAEMLEHFVDEISHPRITTLYDDTMAPTRIAQN